MRHRGSVHITVHYPQSDETRQALRVLAAKIHAETVCRKIQELPCPNEQKLQLLDAVIGTVKSRH